MGILFRECLFLFPSHFVLLADQWGCGHTMAINRSLLGVAITTLQQAQHSMSYIHAQTNALQGGVFGLMILLCSAVEFKINIYNKTHFAWDQSAKQSFVSCANSSRTPVRLYYKSYDGQHNSRPRQWRWEATSFPIKPNPRQLGGPGGGTLVGEGLGVARWPVFLKRPWEKSISTS